MGQYRYGSKDYKVKYRGLVRRLRNRGLVTINVPLFKKLRDIIFFAGQHFMSHFEGHFEGAKTFLTP
jgi:hypothetical protein